MIPFYFGPPDRQLFATYHAPERETEARAALLMCCPFGHEAIRAHRLYRVLADRIVRHYAPARERYLELQSKPQIVDEILSAGANRLAPVAADTMAEVRQKMGLR